MFMIINPTYTITCKNPEDHQIIRTLRSHGWVREIRDRNTVFKYKKNIYLDEKFTFCNSFNKRKKQLSKSCYYKLERCARYAKNFGLEVHAGHGLTYESTSLISNIDDISEFNIGHFIVAESLFVGIKTSIKKFKKIINR